MFKLWKQGEVQSVVFFDANDRLYCVPADPANSDYQQYLAWLDLGNTPEEWKPDGTL